MALRYFWRCEGTTLDSTHDFTTGANTVVANNATLDAAAALVGSLGILVNGGNQHFRVNSAGISSDLRAEGAVGFRVRVVSSPSGISHMLMLRGANFNDYYSVALQGDFTSGGGQVRAEVRSSDTGGTQLSMLTWTANLSLNNIYGIVFRWNQATSTRRIEVYTAGGALITTLEDSSTAWVQPLDLLESGGIRIGESTGFPIVAHMDNIFIADDFDEPIQDYFNITSYTQYGGGVTGPQITDVGDESFTPGETGVTIMGSGFGASQGTGGVFLSPTNNASDPNRVAQTVTGWSDTSIVFTVNAGSLPRGVDLYLFVVNGAGRANAVGYVVQIEATGPSVLAADDGVFNHGETGIVISGQRFGAVQGHVYISPTNNVNDGAREEQTVTSWSDTEIEITAVRGALDWLTQLYLFVVDDSGQSNPQGFSVQFEPRVFIQETVERLNGSPAPIAEGDLLLVWRQLPTIANPNPDQPIALSADANGSINVEIARGDLAPGDPVWGAIVGQSDPWPATMKRITPVYQ